MLSRKPLLAVYTLGVFASIVTGTGSSATAGDSGKSVQGDIRAKVIDGDVPLGPSGPRGPHGPLIIMSDGENSPRVRIGSGIASPTAIKNAAPETGELLTRGSRSTDPRNKGILFFARPPALFGKPLETTVRAVRNDSVTVETPSGEHSIRMPPGRLAASGITVGTKLTITADGNGATVHLRPVSARPTPYAGIYVGAIQRAGEKYVTLRLRGGAEQTFSTNPNLSRIAVSLRGKTIALQSTDGRSARNVLTAQQLNNVLNAIPKTRNHYIGKILNTTDSSVTLDLRDGSSRTFQCSKCADHKIGSVPLVRGLAVYALTDPGAHVLNVAPIPQGTRIVGQITSANPGSLSVMLASGDVAALPCACTKILAGLGDIGPGQPIIADLDRNASIASLLRYPDDGRIRGKLVDLRGDRVSLVLPNGLAKSFACNCHTGSIASSAKTAVGKMVSATLNPDAEVISITAGSPATGVSPAAVWPRQPCRLPQNDKPNTPVQQKWFHDELPCDNQGLKEKNIGQLRPRIPLINVRPPIAGCTNSDSAGIFIALRHWRSQTPVIGASVNLSGAASITLASPSSGYMELLNVPTGMYRITVQKAGLRKLETAAFRVNCDEGVRVQAYLQNAQYRFRIVRIQKRQFVFRVVNKQKAPLNCFYGFPPNDSARALEKTFIVKTAKGYYFCGVKKVTAWKKRSLTAPRK